jgi:uncharacterized protein YqfA (UPF0365 family)
MHVHPELEVPMNVGSAWLSGALIAAIVFVVLFVILPVSLWVSIVAALGAWLVWTAVTGGALGSRHAGH